MKHNISKQKRLLFGSTVGFVMVMVATGLMISPTLLAAADDDDKEKDKDKCGKKHKYDGICDRTKPDLTTSSPTHIKETCIGKNCTVPSIHITGTAFDSDSGIKQVQVCITHPHSCTIVSTSNGPWSYDTPALGHGSHNVTIKAVDNAHNMKRIHIHINVQQKNH